MQNPNRTAAARTAAHARWARLTDPAERRAATAAGREAFLRRYHAGIEMRELIDLLFADSRPGLPAEERERTARENLRAYLREAKQAGRDE